MGKQVTEVEEGVRKLAAKAGNFESQRKDAFWFYEDQAAPEERLKDATGPLFCAKAAGARRVNRIPVGGDLLILFTGEKCKFSQSSRPTMGDIFSHCQS